MESRSRLEVLGISASDCVYDQFATITDAEADVQ